MIKNKYYFIIAIVIILIILSWLPWVTKNDAELRVLNDFNRTWYQFADGCGSYNQNTNKMEPKSISSEKTFFGYLVTMNYDCGGMGWSSWQDTIFVSPFGTAHTIYHTQVK